MRRIVYSSKSYGNLVVTISRDAKEYIDDSGWVWHSDFVNDITNFLSGYAQEYGVSRISIDNIEYSKAHSTVPEYNYGFHESEGEDDDFEFMPELGSELVYVVSASNGSKTVEFLFPYRLLNYSDDGMVATCNIYDSSDEAADIVKDLAEVS